jgi:hypothetical protein
MDAWIKNTDRFIKVSENNDWKPTYKNGFWSRSASLTCMPCCCGLCICWSTIFRIVACPFQCIFHGPEFICSDNGCTSCTDIAVSAYYGEIFATDKVSHVPSTRNISEEDKIKLLNFIDRVQDLFVNAKDLKVQYAIAESIVSPLVCHTVLPISVVQELTALKSILLSNDST